MTGYATIKIPKNLSKEIDEIVAKQCFGYTSRSDFVEDAVRKGLLKEKGVR